MGLPPWHRNLRRSNNPQGLRSGYATRKLYSDDSEAIFACHRPVILTSIEDVVTQQDLLDRTLIHRCPTIGDHARRPECEFWADFRAAHPRLLGAILDILSGTLRHLPDIDLTDRPRLADFATWACAVYEAAGWGAAQFTDDYPGNRGQTDSVALDDPLVGLISRLLGKADHWPTSGEPALSRLHSELKALAGGPAGVAKMPDWPARERDLAGRLRRLAPALRRAGIDFAVGERAKHDRQQYTKCTITRVADNSQPA